MSADLELQRVIPNGKRASDSQDTMSGTGSFTTPSPHDVSTDIVGAVPPVYSTVPEAKVQHGRYVAQNANAQYTSPVGMDTPNMYDLIPENSQQQHQQQRTRSHSPGGQPLMAENVLYGAPADEQMKHRTLTMEKAAAERQNPAIQSRYVGSISSQMMKEPGGEGVSACSGRCCGVCLMLVLVFVVAFLAVAALVLVLSIMFGVYRVCDCASCKYSVNIVIVTLWPHTAVLTFDILRSFAFLSLLYMYVHEKSGHIKQCRQILKDTVLLCVGSIDLLLNFKFGSLYASWLAQRLSVTYHYRHPNL